jgi:hypothetical protein
VIDLDGQRKAKVEVKYVQGFMAWQMMLKTRQGNSIFHALIIWFTSSTLLFLDCRETLCDDDVWIVNARGES